MTNLNDLAVKVTKIEGEKISLPISQVKEVMKILFNQLSKMKLVEVEKILKRYIKI